MSFKFIPALALALTAVPALAGAPSFGDDVGEMGTFLYREPVEIYWNDWWYEYSMEHADEDENSPWSRVFVHGEGKTVDFIASIGIDCEGERFDLEYASNFEYNVDDMEKVQQIVPEEVGERLVAHVCG